MADKHTVITPYLKKDEGDSWSGNDSTVTGGVDVSSKWGNVNIEQSNYKNPKYNYKNKTKSVSYNKGPVTLSYWKFEILTEGADKLTSNLSEFSVAAVARVPVY